jgi:hypothetical protein
MKQHLMRAAGAALPSSRAPRLLATRGVNQIVSQLDHRLLHPI